MTDTTVWMRCDSVARREKMRFIEAETLLKMRNNGGWTLDDKDYEYDTEKRRLVRTRRPAGIRKKK